MGVLEEKAYPCRAGVARGIKAGLETSTSHRVTESSGDSTRFGHVGVRTRVTRESHTRESEHESEANGPQRLENETCAIILPDPAIRADPEATRQRLIEWYFSLLNLHHDHHHHPGSDDCRSRCSDDCQAASADCDNNWMDDWTVTTTGCLTVATAPTQPRNNLTAATATTLLQRRGDDSTARWRLDANNSLRMMGGQ
ncbi:hypothetical protein BDZ89DRAFT_1049628 [Hymenopellis radicata]|nr:hypothetical protein BDZ89DRAFT_1049628 [Hymenopellis radicata]